MYMTRQVLRMTAVVPTRFLGTSQLIYCRSTIFRGFLGSRHHPRGFSFLQGRDLTQELEQLERGECDDRSSSTIYALSTASGKSAIAVVRISGPACMDVSLVQIFVCWGFPHFIFYPECSVFYLILSNIMCSGIATRREEKKGRITSFF